MRKVYKDPKELGMCLKDLVDFYLDNDKAKAFEGKSIIV